MILFSSPGLDETKSPFEQHFLEQLPLFGGEVAARLFLEHRDDLDHLAGGLEVELCWLGSPGSRRSPKCTGVVASEKRATK